MNELKQITSKNTNRSQRCWIFTVNDNEIQTHRIYTRYKIVFRAATKQQTTLSESVNEQRNRNSTKIVLLNVLELFLLRMAPHSHSVPSTECSLFIWSAWWSCYVLLFLFILFDFTCFFFFFCVQLLGFLHLFY